MNYEKIYNQIVIRSNKENRKKYRKGHKDYVYYERHHIIPKCMGGTDDKDNLVLLTAKEHFLCHWLLVEIHPSHSGLRYAFLLMCCMTSDTQERYVPSSRIYEYSRLNLFLSDSAKEKISISRKGKYKGKDNPFYGKKHTEQTIKKIKADRGKQVFTEETRLKMRESSAINTMWYHKPDGTHLRTNPDNPIIKQEGWIEGRFNGSELSKKANEQKRKKYKGIKMPATRSKKCIIDGIIYNSAKEASEILSINEYTLRDRINYCNNEKYKEWKYI